MILNTTYRLVLCGSIISLCGCSAAFFGATERSTSSSLVDYLYPGDQRPVVDPETTPRLELPLRVGIAFVPTSPALLGGKSAAHGSQKGRVAGEGEGRVRGRRLR